MGAHSNDGITSDAWRSSVVSVPPVSRTNKATNQKQIPALVTLCTLGRRSIARPKHSHYCLCLTLRPFVGAREAVLLDLCAAALSARAQVSFLVLLSLGQRDR